MPEIQSKIGNYRYKIYVNISGAQTLYQLSKNAGKDLNIAEEIYVYQYMWLCVCVCKCMQMPITYVIVIGWKCCVSHCLATIIAK